MFFIETTVSREIRSVTNYNDLEIIRKAPPITSETALLETEIDESLGTLFKSIAFCFEPPPVQSDQVFLSTNAVNMIEKTEVNTVNQLGS